MSDARIVVAAHNYICIYRLRQFKANALDVKTVLDTKAYVSTLPSSIECIDVINV